MTQSTQVSRAWFSGWVGWGVWLECIHPPKREGVYNGVGVRSERDSEGAQRTCTTSRRTDSRSSAAFGARSWPKIEIAAEPDRPIHQFNFWLLNVECSRCLSVCCCFYTLPGRPATCAMRCHAPNLVRLINLPGMNARRFKWLLAAITFPHLSPLSFR